MSQEDQALVESKELPSYTDVVIIRTPKALPESELQKLKAQLSGKGFLPILNYPSERDLEEADERFFPADAFREVGTRILEQYEFDGVLSKLQGEVNNQSIENVRNRVEKFDLKGGDYLHLNPLKIFLYASDPYFISRAETAGEVMLDMEKEGWQVFAVRTGSIVPRGSNINIRHEDLDFLQSLFIGKDGKPHTIVAECFADRVLPLFTAHVIPDEEAIRGGCNVADIRNGSILLPVNRVDAPTTNKILQEFAAAEIIELPPNFLDDGGGPRCSISSFSI